MHPEASSLEKIGTAFAVMLVGLCALNWLIHPAGADVPPAVTHSKVLCANIDGDTDPGEVLTGQLGRVAGLVSVSAPSASPGFVVGARTAFGQVCVTVTYR